MLVTTGWRLCAAVSACGVRGSDRGSRRCRSRCAFSAPSKAAPARQSGIGGSSPQIAEPTPHALAVPAPARCANAEPTVAPSVHL